MLQLCNNDSPLSRPPLWSRHKSFDSSPKPLEQHIRNWLQLSLIPCHKRSVHHCLHNDIKWRSRDLAYLNKQSGRLQLLSSDNHWRSILGRLRIIIPVSLYFFPCYYLQSALAWLYHPGISNTNHILHYRPSYNYYPSLLNFKCQLPSSDDLEHDTLWWEGTEPSSNDLLYHHSWLLSSDLKSGRYRHLHSLYEVLFPVNNQLLCGIPAYCNNLALLHESCTHPFRCGRPNLLCDRYSSLCCFSHLDIKHSDMWTY